MTPAPLLADLLTAALAAPPLNDVGTHLVCVDGLAGAGKTTLAGGLARLAHERGVSCAVVHMDDLYAGWTGLLGASETLLRDLVAPLRAGLPAELRRFDWEAGSFAESFQVPPAELVVVEGCGSAPRAIDAVASLVVHVGAPDDVRLARGLARDGEAMRADWLAFMADERTLAEREGTRERADVALDENGAVVRWSSPAAVSARRAGSSAASSPVGGSPA